MQDGNSVKDRKLIYAVGDIHGRHDLLSKIIDIIQTDIDDYTSKYGWCGRVIIVFLGDYIDRGFDSKAVIETLSNLDLQFAELVFLKGNHEAAILEFMENADAGLKWVHYGGRETLASYGIELPLNLETYDDWDEVQEKFLHTIPPYHLLFLRTLKTYRIEGEYMFVHAGMDPNKTLDQQTERDYLWIRSRFLKSTKKLPYIIVHGHTPESAPIWDGRRIGIDTGAYMSNKLTAVRLANGAVDFFLT